MQFPGNTNNWSGRHRQRQRALANRRIFAIAAVQLLWLFFGSGCLGARRGSPSSFSVDPEAPPALLYPSLAAPPVTLAAAAAALGRDELSHELRAFVIYWQQHRQRLLRQHADRFVQAGYGNPALGMARRAELAFTEDDLRQGLQLLHRALETEPPDEALQVMLIAHEYARMLIRQLQQVGKVEHDPDTLAALVAKAELLQKFRTEYQTLLQQPPAQLLLGPAPLAETLAIEWPLLFAAAKPLRALPPLWFFRADNDDRGLAAGWAAPSFQNLAHQWQLLRIDNPWSWQDHNSIAIAQDMQAYRGVAWYAMDFELDADELPLPLFLNLGPVYGSFEVFINGRKAGEGDDCGTAAVLQLPISEYVDATAPVQIVVVRVDDRSGRGGFFGHAWLSAAIAESL